MVFTLTFNTTGGPASYVTWTRDGVNVSAPLEDDCYVASQVAHYVSREVGLPEPLRDYKLAAGNYSNTLTVTGRLPGEYGVSVTNDRTTEPVTSTITVLDFSHPNVSVSRTEDLRSINISWSLNHLATTYLSSYTIKFRACSSDGCNLSRSFQRINVGAKTNHLLSDVTLWTAYNITVEADYSNTQSLHDIVLPGKQGPFYRTAETAGVSTPVTISVSELANITSVRVTCVQPEGGVAVDEYVVYYRRLSRINVQCELLLEVNDSGNNISLMGNNLETVLHLRIHSVYNVSVTGIKGNFHNTSTIVQFATNATVPSETPQNLTVTKFTSTTVTISWDSVECVHRKGLITHYIISYGPESGPVKNVTVNISEPNDGGRYTATGLDPAVSYVFKVAAVNDAGVGVFAKLNIVTLQGQEKVSLGRQASSNKIAIIAGVVTVVLVLLLALVMVGAILVAFRVHKKKSLPIKSVNQVIYEEPYFPSPTEELKMETCPAYDVCNVKKS